MAQELGISEKHSDFQNPFKVDRTEVSCWGLWACLPEGTARPRASRKWGDGWAPRRRGERAF